MLNVKYLLLLFFLTAAESYNLGPIQGIKGCINSKEIIFSDLYYFQIWFSCWLKKSKQTFNTKFVIRRPVEITWIIVEELPFVVVVGGVVVVVTFWGPPLFSTIIDFLPFRRLFETRYGLSEKRNSLLRIMKLSYLGAK